MMGIRRTLMDWPLWLALLAGLWAGGAEAAPEIMPVSEIRPGMKGHCVASLRRGRTEQLEVEVLGSMTLFAGSELILARLSGPVVDEAGIIAGMSGSPVYVDGRLLGAVGYGWSYSKVPIAGITPAEDMLRVREIPDRPPEAAARASRAAAWDDLAARRRQLAELAPLRPGNPGQAGAFRRAAVRLAVPPVLTSARRNVGHGALPADVGFPLPEGTEGRLRPLPLPLVLAGAGPGAEELASLLRTDAFLPVQAVGAARQAPGAGEPVLEPGMPVGAVLIGGDLDFAAMGTVTYVDGDTILAFGHPLFGMGHIDVPLAVGHVETTVPSIARSFRLSSTGKILGRFIQDREPGVLGRLGEEAPMFPCTVRVRGAADQEFNYRVIGHWQMAPFYSFVAIYYSSLRWEGFGERFTMSARSRISVRGLDEPLVLENDYTGFSPLFPSMELVETPMSLLLSNPYEELEIEGVDYELEVRPGLEQATIESAWADRVIAEPGSELTILVRLRPFQGDPVVRKLTLEVPETARPGTRAQVLVCDAFTSRMVDQRMDPGFYNPRDLEALVAVLRKVESNRAIVLRGSFVEEGLRYAGEAMPALPESATAVLQFDTASGRTAPLVQDIVRREPTPWVLSGSQMVSIQIRQRSPQAP